MEYCHFGCLAGHFTTLSEARTHTELTSATIEMITVEIIIHKLVHSVSRLSYVCCSYALLTVNLILVNDIFW